VSIEINGTVITSTDRIKSLGLQIDSKLLWTNHINSLSR
jgi:flagellar biosynthesis regulator FlbT